MSTGPSTLEFAGNTEDSVMTPPLEEHKEEIELNLIKIHRRLI